MKRWTFGAVLCVAAYYAVFGGEYSLIDIRRIRIESDSARKSLAELYAETDSLSVWASALENDSQTLETLAREQFGMIREGEVLYRFADQDVQPDPNLGGG